MADPIPQEDSRFDYEILIKKTEHTADGQVIPYQDVENRMYNMPYEAMAFVDDTMHKAQGALVGAANEKAAAMIQAKTGGRG